MLDIVVNSTPIIALSHIGCLNLLKEIYGIITIPEAVYAEIMAKPDSNSARATQQSLDWIKVQKIQNQLAKSFFKTQLHDGEVEVMVLAKEMEADLCIIDDANAKKFAKNLGLKVTGTLGILLKAKNIGLIHEIKPLLDELIAKGIYLSDTVVSLCLEAAGE